MLHTIITHKNIIIRVLGRFLGHLGGGGGGGGGGTRWK